MNEQVVELLRELAAQLNTTVEFLWEVLIKQAQIFAIVHIVYWVLLGLLIFGAIKMTNWFMGSDFDDDNDTKIGVILATAIVLWIIVIIVAIIQILNIQEFVTALLNPEYWALQQILNLIQ